MLNCFADYKPLTFSLQKWELSNYQGPCFKLFDHPTIHILYLWRNWGTHIFWPEPGLVLMWSPVSLFLVSCLVKQRFCWTSFYVSVICLFSFHSRRTSCWLPNWKELLWNWLTLALPLKWKVNSRPGLVSSRKLHFESSYLPFNDPLCNRFWNQQHFLLL